MHASVGSASHDEVHRVLTQKIFPRQADVVQSADLIKALAA